MSSPIRPFVNVALYGANGHQVHRALVGQPLARLSALAKFPRENLPPELAAAEPRLHPDLDSLLADPEVDLVVLCSPRRADQAADAVRALEAGKHVYAEKPCALEEAGLDEILRAAAHTGRQFHEMAGTAFEPPYGAMRQIVQEGRLGRIVQVIAEKSYPYHEGRVQDEAIDGGLIAQAAVHGFRFIEHVAHARIQSVVAYETTAGNPVAGGGLRMAASIALRLEGGGLGLLAANYLNPRGTGVWGDETLRILGERGVVESTRGGRLTRLIVGDDDLGPVPALPDLDYFGTYLRTLLGQGSMPLSLEDELSPTRWALRAKRAAARA